MTCRDCTEAQANPMRDGFTSRCRSCEARALASVGAHVESEQCGAITPQYRAALERFFGADWRQGHEQVKAWGKRITEASARKKARLA